MVISSKELEHILENEWYGVRHSGEIPEIALYSAIYYLTEDAEGPGLELNGDSRRRLIEAAELRYREIVLRDLQHANRGNPVYRGIKRSIANWGRFRAFCERQNVNSMELRHETAAALLVFLAEEIVEVEQTRRPSSINCSYEELRRFADSLGLDVSVLPQSLKSLCGDQSVPW